jgi:hypothetical protein
LWWLGDLVGYKVHYAQGHGGQNIMNVPALGLVIVTTCNANNSFGDGWDQTLLTTALIGSHILLPIRDELGPAPHAPRRVRGSRSEDRSSGQAEFLDVLRWRPNPRNRDVEIQSHRIYSVGDTTSLLSEVESSQRRFEWQPVDGNSLALYGITAVTTDGEESLPAVAYVHP